MNVVSERYAQSLYELALEEKKIDQYLKDMQLVQDVLDSDPMILSFLSHVLINNEDKCSIIDKSFSGSIDHYVLNFLKLLVKKRRIRYLDEIVESFIQLCQNYLGIEEGIVYTAYELNPDQLHRIEEAMSQKLGKTIQLTQVIDASLIGGIKVDIHSKVYDGSIKNKVAMLKHELLRK